MNHLFRSERCQQLKALCAAATPGPWRQDGRLIVEQNGDAVAMVNIARPAGIAFSDAGLIAALSPEVVAAMIACIEAADAMREGLDNIPPTTKSRNELHIFDAARAVLEQA